MILRVMQQFGGNETALYGENLEGDQGVDITVTLNWTVDKKGVRI
jgi:hypothetical protein